jgi:hypothetical protein
MKGFRHRSKIMPSFSGRMKVSLLGAVALWIFARSVFAMSNPPIAVTPAHVAPVAVSSLH